MDESQSMSTSFKGSTSLKDNGRKAKERPRGVLTYCRRHHRQILALVFSLAVTALILAFHRELVELRRYGYLGVFVISVLGNATIILPVPSMAVIFAGGSVLHPALVGLVAGLGEPLGELTGYLAGYGGSAVIENRVQFDQIQRWMVGRGFLTLFALSAIPNPLFDLAGIAAGMLRYPVSKFLLACWLGKTTKALAIAYIGSVSVDLLQWLVG